MQQDEIPVAQPIKPPPQAAPRPQPSGRAIAALILGILSIFCAGILTGVPAIILGMTELKAIRLGTSPSEGETISKVGLVLGIIGTVFTLLAILVTIAFIALGISLGTSSAVSNAVPSSI